MERFKNLEWFFIIVGVVLVIYLLIVGGKDWMGLLETKPCAFWTVLGFIAIPTIIMLGIVIFNSYVKSFFAITFSVLGFVSILCVVFWVMEFILHPLATGIWTVVMAAAITANHYWEN